MARRRRVIGSVQAQARRNEPGRRAVTVPKLRGKATTSPEKAPAKRSEEPLPLIRIGHGWDLHRLEPIAPIGIGRPMVIGGVRIDDAGGGGKGPVAHSDGDVLLHAATDAILGAMSMPDIGQLFPDKSHRNEGRVSSEFLAAAVAKAARAGYVVGNMDCTIICERPKIGPVKAQIRQNLARLLGVPLDRVNVKGKTHERVDAVGEGRAIEAHAVVLMVPRPKG